MPKSCGAGSLARGILPDAQHATRCSARLLGSTTIRPGKKLRVLQRRVGTCPTCDLDSCKDAKRWHVAVCQPPGGSTRVTSRIFTNTKCSGAWLWPSVSPVVATLIGCRLKLTGLVWLSVDPLLISRVAQQAAGASALPEISWRYPAVPLVFVAQVVGSMNRCAGRLVGCWW